MNVYVETNFVLELAFMQEQHESCEGILTLCEAGSAHLVLPAFCIAESYETQIRRSKEHDGIMKYLTDALGRLARSKPYQAETHTLQNVTGLLARSLQDEDQRLNDMVDRLLRVADMIPLDASVIADAMQFSVKYRLAPQDSLVYSSISHHLIATSDVDSCFINRDKHFADPDIVESLTDKGCRLLFNFDDGYHFIRYRAQRRTE